MGRVELDYPREISMWRGVPSDIDAAFQYIDGKTYFFKGRNFWQFDDNSMMVADPMPKRIGTHWMQCPKDIIRNPFEANEISSAEKTTTSHLLVFYLVIFVSAINSFD